ncbi:MAG: hypothetical protein OEV66_06490 [Spirochaetia bacterium]|nr:hypothetical protein [Spirochaetia bacterium]
MLTQKFISNDRLFSLEYPRMWDTENFENIPAFFDPLAGKGALQILAVNNTDVRNFEMLLKHYPYLAGTKLSDKMVLFLHFQDVPCQPDQLKMFSRNEIRYIPFEYSHEGRFYMAVMMEKSGVLLVAVYNSASIPDEQESLIIGNIVNSIEIYGEKN